MNELKARLTAWYNRKISAGWYRSASLIGGWAVAGIAWLPDLAQYVVDHFDFFGGVLLPKLSPEAKAAALGFYVTFLAPPLRAWIQETMQKMTIKQQAEAGKVVPLPASGVPGAVAPAVAAMASEQAEAEAAARPAAESTMLLAERRKADPGPPT